MPKNTQILLSEVDAISSGLTVNVLYLRPQEVATTQVFALSRWPFDLATLIKLQLEMSMHGYSEEQGDIVPKVQGCFRAVAPCQCSAALCT